MKQSGQSLWEVILALFIASLVAVGLVKMTSFAVKDTRFSKEQSQATGLGQKKVNEYVNLRNQDMSSFFAAVPLYSTDTASDGFCLFSSLTDVSAIVLPTTTPDYLAARTVKISVDVFWGEKSAGSDCDNKSFDHKLHFETYVTN